MPEHDPDIDLDEIERILEQALSLADEDDLSGVNRCADQLPDIPYTIPVGPAGTETEAAEQEKNIHGLYKHIWWTSQVALNKARSPEEKQLALLDFASRETEHVTELYEFLDENPASYREAMLNSFHLVLDGEGLPVDGSRVFLERELERMRQHLAHFDQFRHLDIPYRESRAELEENIAQMAGALEYYKSRQRKAMGEEGS